MATHNASIFYIYGDSDQPNAITTLIIVIAIVGYLADEVVIDIFQGRNVEKIRVRSLVPLLVPVNAWLAGTDSR